MMLWLFAIHILAVCSAYQRHTMQRAAVTERYVESVVVSTQQYYMVPR